MSISKKKIDKWKGVYIRNNLEHKAFICTKLNSHVYHWRELLIDAKASRSLREKVGREGKAEVAQRWDAGGSMKMSHPVWCPGGST